MLAGARRGGRKPALGVRDPVPGQSPGPKKPDDDGDALFLRLALAQGSLGLELTRNVTAGPFELVELQIRLAGLRFPVDLSGGVRRFRHVRGELQRARVEIALADAGAFVLSRAKAALPGSTRAVVAAAIDGVSVGLATEDGALAFDVVIAPVEKHLRVIVDNARAEGLRVAAHALACRVVAAVLGPFAVRTGSAFIVEDPLLRLCRAVLPDSGARVPSTDEVRLSLGVADDARSGRVVVGAERGAAHAALSMRAVRAIETCELLTAADDHAIAGDMDAARAAYLELLERAPRHIEATMRLAALDMATGGRAEAALATLMEIASPSDAGFLGSDVLEAVGETEAAYAAASKAAAGEGYGWLAARGWARAARLAPDRAAAVAALDEALVRSPSFEPARWARIDRRLATGDVRASLGDVEHLEANARGKDARHTVLRRAAEMFFERGHLAEAERLFEQCLRYEPRSARAVAGLAKALRDRGKIARALDLFGRAIALAHRDDPGVAYELEADLAEALAVYADDRPNAIARVAAIPQTSSAGPRARVLEASWRAELGDDAGAARALARLRSIAESIVEGPPRAPNAPLGEGDEALASALERAATIDEQRGDLRAARRDLELHVRLRPANREAARRLARLARAAPAIPLSEDTAEPEAPPAAPIVPETKLATLFDAMDEDAGGEDSAALEERVEQLTAKLRGDPRDDDTAMALALTLETLGRDMDLFALLSARMEESPSAPGIGEMRRRVLRRLAEAARREGRPSEAELYESMLEG